VCPEKARTVGHEGVTMGVRHTAHTVPGPSVLLSTSSPTHSTGCSVGALTCVLNLGNRGG
jgi:hypothetical protein